MSTTKLSYTLDEIDEADKVEVSTRRYRRLRDIGVSHEIILELARWFKECHLHMAARGGILRALEVVHELQLDYRELKRFGGFKPDHLRDFARLLRHAAREPDGDPLEVCYWVFKQGISPQSYIRSMRD